MAKSISDTTKKRGRPRTTGKGEQIGTRWQESLLRSIDAWREAQEGGLSRAEAIRRLVELGLGTEKGLVSGASKRPALTQEVQRKSPRPKGR
jgi:hypothetical protein